MFNTGSDNMSLAANLPGQLFTQTKTLYYRIVALCRATVKNNLFRFATQKIRRALARQNHAQLGILAELMERRSIAELLDRIWLHRLKHLRINRRCRRVV